MKSFRRLIFDGGIANAMRRRAGICRRVRGTNLLALFIDLVALICAVGEPLITLIKTEQHAYDNREGTDTAQSSAVIHGYTPTLVFGAYLVANCFSASAGLRGSRGTNSAGSDVLAHFRQ